MIFTLNCISCFLTYCMTTLLTFLCSASDKYRMGLYLKVVLYRFLVFYMLGKCYIAFMCFNASVITALDSLYSDVAAV